jgi:hypothetical protein
MTQEQQVLDHLQSRGSINCLEAIQRYGITRISAKIWDLRQVGHAVKSVRSKRADGFTEYVYDVAQTKMNLTEELRLETLDLISVWSHSSPEALARVCTQQANKALAITFIGR